jgi:hypothetical protein
MKPVSSKFGGGLAKASIYAQLIRLLSSIASTLDLRLLEEGTSSEPSKRTTSPPLS